MDTKHERVILLLKPLRSRDTCKLRARYRLLLTLRATSRN
jgi:hypothetical protein